MEDLVNKIGQQLIKDVTFSAGDENITYKNIDGKWVEVKQDNPDDPDD